MAAKTKKEMTQVLETKVKSKEETKAETKVESAISIRRKINGLLETIEKSWYDISILLKNIYERELYKKWGFANFEQYSNSELDMDYRIALYRVQIGKIIEKYNLQYNDVNNMGWTKFKEISKLLKDCEELNKEEVIALLAKTKDMSYRETEDFIKRIREDRYTEEGIAIKKKIKFQFIVNEEQASIIESAINLAMSFSNTENKSIALEYLCAEWLTEANSASNIKEVEEEV